MSHDTVSQGDLFDQIAASRDEAITRVDAHADVDWKAAAYATGIRIAEREEYLISEDIWQALVDAGVHTHEPRAMGAVMKRLSHDKVIAPTDRFITSPSPLGHGRPSRMWESLIWPGRDRTLESDARPTAYRNVASPCVHGFDNAGDHWCPICPRIAR